MSADATTVRYRASLEADLRDRVSVSGSQARRCLPSSNQLSAYSRKVSERGRRYPVRSTRTRRSRNSAAALFSVTPSRSAR
jgi:hypothetical protein